MERKSCSLRFGQSEQLEENSTKSPSKRRDRSFWPIQTRCWNKIYRHTIACHNRVFLEMVRPPPVAVLQYSNYGLGGPYKDDDDDQDTPILKSVHHAGPILPGHSCAFGSPKYFLLCGLGGIVSCGTTHTLLTPLDLMKCRLQVDKAKYKSIYTGANITLAEEGAKGLITGWAPTLIGYSFQGMFKFGMYEVFKVYYHDLIGDENSYQYQSALYLASSASAEFFADIALCPWEACKVRMQTMPGYATTLRECFPKILNEEGINGFYKGIVPLWGRQIPYTMMKFACFEKTVVLLYENVVPKPRQDCTKLEQLGVTFAAGYIAGVFCALVSHPADTLVSKMNQMKGATMGDIIQKIGFMGLWQGLGPRIIMIGTLTALQWFIYDGFKVYMKMPRPPPPEMPESLRRRLILEGKLDP